ncbi:hypothetical protein ACFSQT_01175 [Mesorhizobium calcicola]|uniref:Uncharacterized protein n=1 Tax=Mesorhizobium calcicola TaxID=1300310 RepID=A0ABW4W895_9HYPH
MRSKTRKGLPINPQRGNDQEGWSRKKWRNVRKRREEIRERENEKE